MSVRGEYAPSGLVCLRACGRTFRVHRGQTSAHIDPTGGWDCPTGGGLGPLIRTFTHLVEYGWPRPRAKWRVCVQHSGLSHEIAGCRRQWRVHVQTTRYDWHRCAQNADHLARNSPFSALFSEVVCTLGTTPPRVAASPSPDRGNRIIRDLTRRRHAASQRLMLQNPHRSQPRAPRRRQDLGPAPGGAKNSPNTDPPAALPRTNSPCSPKNAEFGVL